MLDLFSLNEQQKKAVTAPLGPVLVLAGAGSGKTRVLAYRVVYLIEKQLVSAPTILALTFTNKAAKEMQQRVNALLSEKYKVESRKSNAETFNFQLSTFNSSALPTMGTFHSIGAKILRKEISALGYASSFIIFDADDTLKVIKEICQELSVSPQFPPPMFRHAISTAKILLQTPDIFDIGLEEPVRSLVSQVYARYQNFLYKQNAVDFDDLLMLPIKIFEAKADILARYKQLFQYILVDEYQDTNPAQYRFLQLLAPAGNIFVVGDDAQSIYGFRGSDIRNILHFEKDFPKALVIALEQNYRSTKYILTAASSVITLNPEQKEKTLWTHNEDGEKVRIQEVEDEVAEAAFVAKEIVRLSNAAGTVQGSSIATEPGITYEPEPENEKPFSILDQFLKKAKRQNPVSSLIKLPEQHLPLSEFAVLYRTHAQSRALEEMFITASIPYQIVGGVKFYERKEIKDLLAYVRLVVNFRDLVSLKRVINVPARGVGEKSYEVVKDFIQRHEFTNEHTNDTNKTWGPNSSYSRHSGDISVLVSLLQSISLPAKSKQAVTDFFSLIHAATQFDEQATLPELLQWLIKKIRIEKFLRDGTEVGETRWENVQELCNVAVNFSNVPWKEGVQVFLEEVALFTDLDTVEDQKDAVTLMSLHSAKGLEFDTVFFVGLEEGIMPHSRSLLDPKETAEEIRLAYVGLTRARKRLFLVYARSRNLWGNRNSGMPSRILRVLPEEIVEFRGQRGYTGRPGSGEVEYEAVE